MIDGSSVSLQIHSMNGHSLILVTGNDLFSFLIVHAMALPGTVYARNHNSYYMCHCNDQHKAIKVLKINGSTAWFSINKGHE